MNKSLLIVICDFLVSAMLAMMTGMVPAHSGGTGVGLDENTTKLLLSELDSHRSELEKLRRHIKQAIESSGASPELEAELRQITRDLAANRIKREQLMTILNSTPQNTGKLSETELKRRLDEALLRRAELEIVIQDRDQTISHTRERLSDAREKLSEAKEQIRVSNRDIAANRRELSRTRDALAKTSEALVDMTRAQVESQRRLAAAETEISAGRQEIQRREQEIMHQKEQLRLSAARLGSVQGENRSMQSRLDFTSGQLRMRERDYAMLQDRRERVEGELMVEKLAAAEMRARSEELGRTLKATVAKLSEAQAKVEALIRDKAVADTKLATRAAAPPPMVQVASAPRRNDVISSYASAVVGFTCKVTEEKIFGKHTGLDTFYLPVVDFGGRKLIIGTVNKFAGDANTALSFKNVTDVLFTVHTVAARGDTRKQRVATPMLILAPENRTAAFDYPGKERKALPLLTEAALTKRGLDGLYLFKCRSFGRESALLDGRCSMPVNSFMFIRNGRNTNLNAEPGDFIISREGEFVGIAIATDTIDSGKVRGVRIQLFNDPAVWQNALILPVTRKTGSEYFDRFSAKMAEIRRNIPADSRKH